MIDWLLPPLPILSPLCTCTEVNCNNFIAVNGDCFVYNCSYNIVDWCFISCNLKSCKKYYGIYIYSTIYIYIYYIYLYLYLSISLYIYILYLYLSISISIYLSIYLCSHPVALLVKPEKICRVNTSFLCSPLMGIPMGMWYVVSFPLGQ